jgi:amino-acid N-acetyltransferase
MAQHAVMTDAEAICELINHYAERGRMLHRSLESTYECVRDFLVCRRDVRLAGCVALTACWKDLAEIRSLAVAPELRGVGIGRELLLAAVEDARAMGLRRIFTLTYEEDFFRKFGFRVVDKESLPAKVWRDCLHCPRADACDEVAMVLDLDERPTG